jgi:phage gp46-like protein
MAEDIKINWDDDLMGGDFALVAGDDLERELGLGTAVLISLFTDRRADPEDVIDDENDRRGWWADEIAEVDGDQIGSKLWQLERSKTVVDNAAKCRQYIKEALQWMLDDEVVQDIEIDVFRQGDIPNEQLAFEVRLYKSDGTFEAFKFDDLWTAQFAEE